ncbi:hypothetical protein Poli38472_014115 [Pythium oligandrum]|uniref:AB hydrolase-1 domain-containing protein n=1 Tax=Pythium oligandrum TaxID=41045 RepID=A0A8K1CR29_PYTOL|nr:hypothetical protein Poli38472_014115 [Pythium oligandrum]|eukprot:TMW66803.1 hypothetical protein Poli38472_014115 [Pythium oligandrum]
MRRPAKHGEKEAAAAQPELPESRTVEVNGCVIEYVDTKPTRATGDQSPTIVLLHGAPGSLRDFRHLIPLLQDRARVVAINLPGFGKSHAIQEEDRFTAVHAAKAGETVYHAISEICRDDPHVFVVGHSFGGHSAINVVAAADKDKGVDVKGMALVASAGHRPHRTLAPRLFVVLSWLIESKIPVVSSLTMSLTRWIYTTIVGFPRTQPLNYYVSALLRKNSTNYDAVMKQLEGINHIPSFIAWSKRDHHIEEEIALNLSHVGGAGPRVAFVGGGHNIQKTRAPVLARELLSWVDDLVKERKQSYNKEPVVVE